MGLRHQRVRAIHVVQKTFEGRSRTGCVDRFEAVAQLLFLGLNRGIGAHQVLIHAGGRTWPVGQVLHLPVKNVQCLYRVGGEQILTGPRTPGHPGDRDGSIGNNPLRDRVIGHLTIAGNLVDRRQFDAGEQLLQLCDAPIANKPGISFRGGAKIECLAGAQKGPIGLFVCPVLAEVFNGQTGIGQEGAQRSAWT